MKYEKPNIALVASAVEVVKSQAKSQDPNPDATRLFVVTIAAYESDE